MPSDLAYCPPERGRRQVAVLSPVGHRDVPGHPPAAQHAGPAAAGRGSLAGRRPVRQPTWRHAIVLAWATGAAPTFAHGLPSQAPELADRIGAPDLPTDIKRLLLNARVSGREGLQVVIEAGSRQARVKALGRRLVPPVDLVRMTERAEPGRGRPRPAYGWRWRRLAGQALEAWRRARRHAG